MSDLTIDRLDGGATTANTDHERHQARAYIDRRFPRDAGLLLAALGLEEGS